MTDSLPEWVPDEYDPDAPLAERLPVIAEMGSDAEIHVQDKRGVHYVVNQPQDLGTLPNDGLRLDCGTRIDYWSYEIVAPANTSPSCERSIRIRTTKRTSRLGRRSAVILTCACTASTWTGSRTTRRRPRHEHHSLAAAVRAPHASRRPRRDRRLPPRRAPAGVPRGHSDAPVHRGRAACRNGLGHERDRPRRHDPCRV